METSKIALIVLSLVLSSTSAVAFPLGYGATREEAIQDLVRDRLVKATHDEDTNTKQLQVVFVEMKAAPEDRWTRGGQGITEMVSEFELSGSISNSTTSAKVNGVAYALCVHETGPSYDAYQNRIQENYWVCKLTTGAKKDPSTNALHLTEQVNLYNSSNQRPILLDGKRPSNKVSF